MKKEKNELIFCGFATVNLTFIGEGKHLNMKGTSIFKTYQKDKKYRTGTE